MFGQVSVIKNAKVDKFGKNSLCKFSISDYLAHIFANSVIMTLINRFSFRNV